MLGLLVGLLVDWKLDAWLDKLDASILCELLNSDLISKNAPSTEICIIFRMNKTLKF